MLVVTFKSTPEFYEKEKDGIKNNTVRESDNGVRFESLKNVNLQTEQCYVKIVNCETKEFFSRKIRDISIYNNIYILTW